jgi:hypothetical protein
VVTIVTDVDYLRADRGRSLDSEQVYSSQAEVSMSTAPGPLNVPFSVEQDSDGIRCAHAWLGSSGGANGNGATREEAIADMRAAVQMVMEEDGISGEGDRP